MRMNAMCMMNECIRTFYLSRWCNRISVNIEYVMNTVHTHIMHDALCETIITITQGIYALHC